MKWLRWMFWRIVYAVRPRSKDLAAYLLRADRTRPPWQKFKSSVYHSDAGGKWFMYLTDEPDYVVSGCGLPVELHIGQDSGDVIGLTIWDEHLRDAAKWVRDKTPTKDIHRTGPGGDTDQAVDKLLKHLEKGQPHELHRL